jgi:hypothetical protein
VSKSREVRVNYSCLSENEEQTGRRIGRMRAPTSDRQQIVALETTGVKGCARNSSVSAWLYFMCGLCCLVSTKITLHWNVLTMCGVGV